MDKRDIALLCAFIIIFSTLSLLVISGNSHSYHDGENILNGLFYLKTGNSFNTAQHPILIPTLAAFPLLFTDVELPSFTEVNNNPKLFGLTRFLYYKSNNADLILVLAKIPMVIIALLLGIYIYKWAKELYGFKSGVFALLLYTFFPTVLAYAGSLAADIAIAAFFLISLYYFWKFLKIQNFRNLFFTSLFFSFAVLSKSFGFFLLPIFLIIILASVYSGLVLQFPIKKPHSYKYKLINIFLIFAILLLIFISVFILAYIREWHPIYNANDPLYENAQSSRSNERLSIIINQYIPFDSPALKNTAYFFLTQVPVPGPHFFQGIYTTGSYAAGMDEYLMGGYSRGIKWKYYALSFLIKTPIPFLIMLLLSLVLFKKVHPPHKWDYYSLLVPVLFFIFMINFMKMYGGHRYFLIIFPLIFIFISNLVNVKLSKGRILFSTTLIFLLLLYIGGTIKAYPYYVSYFNGFVDEDNSYRYLIGPDIDDTHDYKRLEKYIINKNLTEVKLNVTGSISRPVYNFNFNYESLPAQQPTAGILIININTLVGINTKASQDFRWLRNFEPIDRVGSSILIYNITQPQLIAKGY